MIGEKSKKLDRILLERIMQKEIREKIVTGMKKSGFRYISLDLEGYRTGSLNPQNQ